MSNPPITERLYALLPLFVRQRDVGRRFMRSSSP